MKHYLVIARCDMDDVPLRLFDNPKLADRYADAVTREQVIETAWKVMRIDLSAVGAVGVVEFTDGMPSVFMGVIDFDEADVEGA